MKVLLDKLHSTTFDILVRCLDLLWYITLDRDVPNKQFFSGIYECISFDSLALDKGIRIYFMKVYLNIYWLDLSFSLPYTLCLVRQTSLSYCFSDSQIKRQITFTFFSLKEFLTQSTVHFKSIALNLKFMACLKCIIEFKVLLFHSSQLKSLILFLYHVFLCLFTFF